MSYISHARGEILKRDAKDRTLLERRVLVKMYEMELDRVKCIGCGLCSDNCPKEAIQYTEAEFLGMKALSRPSIDFEARKCVLCGECVSICPMHALSMRVDNEDKVPVVELNVFAAAIKKRW